MPKVECQWSFFTVLDGLRVFGAGAAGGLLGATPGPVLEQFLAERADLFAGVGFGLVGSDAAREVLLQDVEDGLDALAQLRAGRQTLFQRERARWFPNRQRARWRRMVLVVHKLPPCGTTPYHKAAALTATFNHTQAIAPRSSATELVCAGVLLRETAWAAPRDGATGGNQARTDFFISRDS
jgi:hypothetical protein